MADQSDNSKRTEPPGGMLPNRRRIVMIGGGACLALILLAAFFVFSRPSVETSGSYQEALRAIDSGNYESARLLAAEMYQSPLSFEQAAAPLYVLGAAAELESEQSLNERQRNELLVLATRYLEEAQERGFPQGRETDGALRLARCLFHSGLFARCLPIVKQLSENSPAPIPEAERMLAGAYLRDSDPQYEQALRHIDRYLASTDLSLNDRWVGEMEKARVLIALRRLPEAAMLIDEIAPRDTDAERILLQGQLALAEARQSNPPNPAAYKRAKELLQSAADRDVTDAVITAQAEYLLGIADREAGNAAEAIVHFSRVRRLYDTFPEGWSASLAEGELLLAAGENEAALESLQQAAHTAGESAVYSNPWIGLLEFRSRLRGAFGTWIERGEYAIANKFAKELPPIFPLEESVQMRADAHRLWGESLARRAETVPRKERSALESEARRRHRLAAKLYAWLADLRYATPHYPHDVWNSSQQYLAGHDFQAAAKTLNKYLQIELRARRPEALTSLAQAQLSLNRLEEAYQAVTDVLENYPKHPETYRARLIGSEIWVARRRKGSPDELVHLAEARRLLEANLTEEALTPRSLEWRDSLFALGNVLTLEAKVQETASRVLGVDEPDDPERTKAGLSELEKSYETNLQAIRRLDEATRRYPDAPQANLAAYQLAEAYRNAAKFPRKKLPLVLIQTTRVQLSRQLEEQLAAAYDIYRDLQNRLNQKQEREELLESEQAILRNCYFARAETLFDRGQYEEAIREYSSASNRYQHDPASLEAFVQIASCYRQLGRPYEARGTLEQAKVVLQRIRDDADFAQTTRFDRDEWAKLLDLLSSL